MARKFTLDRVEFTQDGGLTWTEITNVVLYETPEPERTNFTDVKGRNYFLRINRELVVASLDVTAAWVSTLRTAMQNGDNNITVRVTHNGTQTETYQNCTVEVYDAPAQPDRPAVVFVRFSTGSYDGTEFTFA